jgi:trehalose 6-phosphate phosphatase
MATSPVRSQYQSFFQQLADAPQRILLLDYDGTLAPFTVDRDHAHPYPAVRDILNCIMALGTTRVIIVSGRPAAELPLLLSLENTPEIWGSHGLESIDMQGRRKLHRLDPALEGLLHAAHARLKSAGLIPQVEAKPGGLAVHWRGLCKADAENVCTTATRVFHDLARNDQFRLLPFHCGIELRVKSPNKGTVVQLLQKDLHPLAAISYLGDDHTDEDAFEALRPSGLSVLISEHERRTAASVWLRPPDELVGFLSMWLSACGGYQ